QVNFLDAHPDVDLVGTGAFTIDGCSHPRGVRGVGPLNTAPGAILRRGLFLHPTVTGRTDWFRKNRYDPSFPRSQDFELWCRVGAPSRLSSLPDPLLFYREAATGQVRNYVMSCRAARRVYRLYGPKIVGRLATTLLCLKSLIKGGVYRVGTLLGLESR